MKPEQPTMVGFEWSPRQVAFVPPAGGDGFCLRDAVCELLGWPPGSNEWLSFIESPAPKDPVRLFDHLGLKWYDPQFQPHDQELATKLDHPGIVIYSLHAIRQGHAVFEPHLRHPRGLPRIYAQLAPEVLHVVVDDRQPPR